MILTGSLYVGTEVDNMEVRFLMAEARGPSLRFGFFLLLSLPVRVKASGTRVEYAIYTRLTIMLQIKQTYK